MALVYIYRAPSFSNAARGAEIDVDGVKIAWLKNRTYAWFYVPAHAHTLKLRWTTLPIYIPDITDLYRHDDAPVFVWKDGETYFYKFQSILQSVYPVMVVDTTMQTPSAADALPELAIYRYSPAFNLEKLTLQKEAAPEATPPPSSAPSSPSAAAPAPGQIP